MGRLEVSQWYPLWNITAIVLSMTFVALSIADGLRCPGASECGGPSTFRLSEVRQSEATVLLLISLFMLYGLLSSPNRPRLAWYFATAAALNLSMGTTALFVAMRRSTEVDVDGFFLSHQRTIFVASLALSIGNDLNVAVGFRDRRLPGLFMSSLICAVSMASVSPTLGTPVQSRPWIIRVLVAGFYVLGALQNALEILRGPLDRILDPLLSFPAHACCSVARASSDRTAQSQKKNGKTCSSCLHYGPQNTVREGLPKLAAVRPGKTDNMADVDNAEDRLAAGSSLGTILGGTAHPYLVDRQDDSDSQYDFRGGRLSAVHWMVILYHFSTASYPIEYFASRILGASEQDTGLFTVIADAMVVLLRCALALVIVHSDITAVAQQASRAQEWQRKAADARLGAIQQFTRYIFHEARVPLQAVTLAVDELEESLGEARGLSQRLRRRGGTAGLASRSTGAAAPEAGEEAASGLLTCLEEARDVLESQREGCKGLQHIFNDVLEAQRIEQGRLRLRNDAVSLRRVLREINTVFRRSARAGGIDLKLQHAADMPDSICGDGVRIKQVLANLVSNALKFTPEGGTVSIEVVCSGGVVAIGTVGSGGQRDIEGGIALSGKNLAADRDSDGKAKTIPSCGESLEDAVLPALCEHTVQVQMMVRDTGCGLSPADLKGLFTPYKQARHGVAYTGSSSGLGLYISRGIARQMGGDLTASSEGEGKGSVFVFSFVAVSTTISQADEGGGGRSSTVMTMSDRWRLPSARESSTQSSGAGIVLVGSVQAGGDQRYSPRNIVASDGALKGQLGGQPLVGGQSTSGAVGAGGQSSGAPTGGIAISVQVGGTTSSLGRADGRNEAVASSKSVLGVVSAPAGIQTGGGSSAGLVQADTSGTGRRRVVRKKRREKGGKEAEQGGSGPGKAAGGDFGWCLVVDDVATNRKLLARGMRRLGYDVELAADGREAVEACRKRAAAAEGGARGGMGLITMDKSMPVMDGIEATRVIRSEFGSSFVIVGLTGDALGEDLESFKEAGLDGVLGKPASAKKVHAKAQGIVAHLST